MSTATNPPVKARVPEHIQRRGKMKAAALGVRFGEYLADLIEKDTTEAPESQAENTN